MKLLSSPVEYVRSRVRLFGFSYISLEDEVILKLCDLPRHHGDPFDGIIIATAMSLSVPLLGKERASGQYPIDLIW